MKTKRLSTWLLTLAVLALVAADAMAQANKSATAVRGQPIKPLEAKPVTPATNAPAPPAPSATSAEARDGDFLVLGFDKLAAFNYDVPDESTNATNKVETAKAPDQIPATIRALDRQRVALKGFMLPLKVEGGLITELLIMRDQSMCCYGSVPKINEWVSVKMTGKGVKPIMDQAVTLYGKLKVGEVRENGYLVGIYEMDGEKMSGPVDL
ncbi:MAG: DUF3299 domain-containing protein [Verrucomicrobia bacterium]|nr:DUF3299 domain-containing protein [Verrucomicrobiota bacterium]